MGEVITVVSGKGGVGKTTITSNIGIALSKLGNKVLIVDSDMGLRNLDLALGMENKIVYDMIDLLEGTCQCRQAIIRDKRFKNFYLMSSSQTRKNIVTPDKMKSLFSQLKNDYDYIIIDSPSGIETGYENAIAPADSILIVATPELTSIRDADRILKDAVSRNIKRQMLIINKVRSDLIKKGVLPGIDYMIRTLKADIVGILHYSEQIFIATNRGVPIASINNSKYYKIFEEIASRIMNIEKPLFND